MPNNEYYRLLIEEYKATQDMFKFFNTLRWQVGSVLIGTIGVVTGFVFYSPQAEKWFFFLFFFSLILMSTWAVYGEVCTYYGQIKADRLHALEAKLGFRQHINCKPKRYMDTSIVVRLSILGIPLLFLFLWLRYYGIIVVVVIIIVLLYLRKRVTKEHKKIVDSMGEILDSFWQRTMKGKHVLRNKERTED